MSDDDDDVFHGHGDGHRDGLPDDGLLDDGILGLQILYLRMNSTRMRTLTKSLAIGLSSHAYRVCCAQAEIGNHPEDLGSEYYSRTVAGPVAQTLVLYRRGYVVPTALMIGRMTSAAE